MMTDGQKGIMLGAHGGVFGLWWLFVVVLFCVVLSGVFNAINDS